MIDEVIAEAVRVEYDEETGRMFLVFEVKGEKNKLNIRTNWTQDVEYKLIGKNLVKNE